MTPARRIHASSRAALIMSGIRRGLKRTRWRIEMRHQPRRVTTLELPINEELHPNFLALHNTGCQEYEQLLFRDRFGFLLEKPTKNRHSREIRDTNHTVVLRIDKDSADYHGL